MTPSEAIALARYVKACCPQQVIDEFTPDVWHDLLGDLDLAECRAAVAEVARRQPFVAPSEMREEVFRTRAERLHRNPVPDPPAELLDDPEAYRRYVRETRQAIERGDADAIGAGDGPRAIGSGS